MHKISFTLNGNDVTTHYSEQIHGLDLLKNCGNRDAITSACASLGNCGNCTILVNGQPMLACLTRPDDLAGKEIETQGSDAEACLIRYSGQHLGRREIVKNGKMLIGREDFCEIQLSAISVSREHATITKDMNDIFYLSDLGSTNGTLLNFKVITEPTPLHNGDMICIGSTLFKFYRNNNIESAIHDRMYRLAAFDELTRVYNRKFLLESLEIEISQAKVQKRKMSVLFIDLDYFKQVNDTFGHQAGDEVLRVTAKLLRNKITKADIIGRYGGEEFLMILPGAQEDDAMATADRVRRAVAEHSFVIDAGKSICSAEAPKMTSHRQTISLGVAWLRGESLSASSILADADRSLYASKEAGRNQVTGIHQVQTQKILKIA